MRKLLPLLWIQAAIALPPIEEAERILGAGKMKEREEFTATLWASGPSALPLLEKLASSDDPEISQRASFVYQRLRMGLRPDSPPEILELTSSLQFSKPSFRTARLKLLLDHPQGVPVGLAFLNQWSQENPLDPDLFQSWTDQLAEHLLEQRSFWQQFLSYPLTTRCRGALVISLDGSDMPMAFRMIEILALNNPKEIFGHASKRLTLSSHSTYEAFARAALLNNDLETALEVLFQSLAIADENFAAREIAFLEQFEEQPARRYKGPLESEVKNFRYRLRKNHEALAAVEEKLPPESFLIFENSLATGMRRPLSKDLPVSNLARSLHKSLLAYTNEPSQVPDIKTLSSTITNEAGRLARGLYLLGSPEEAAQVMTERHQNDFAIRILWMTGLRDEARKLADLVMLQGDFKARLSARLTMIQLLGREQELGEARILFAPLFEESIKFDHLRRQAIHLGRLLFEKEQILKLAPEIGGESPYRRQLAIAALLPFPSAVSIRTYEMMLEEHPDLKPVQLLSKVEEHLSQDREKLLQQYEPILEERAKDVLKSSDADFQLALFLKSPTALKIVEGYSWHRLDIGELEKIIADDGWDMELRRKALDIALRIAPGKAKLRALDHSWNSRGSLDLVAKLTLGDPSEVKELDPLLDVNQALSIAAEICDPNTSSGIQCLHQAANRAFAAKNHVEAKRLFEYALIGELVLGTQPGTQYGVLTENMTKYLGTRVALASTPDSRKHWESTLSVWKKVED